MRIFDGITAEMLKAKGQGVVLSLLGGLMYCLKRVFIHCTVPRQFLSLVMKKDISNNWITTGGVFA